MKNNNSNFSIQGLKLLALISGMCGIGYEILFIRLLSIYLGDMFYMQAALLSTFMIGIGIGAKKAYRYYPYLYIIEIGIGVYALCLPHLLELFEASQWLQLTLLSPLATTFLTVLFLIIPSLLIGFSIPLFSHYLKSTQTKDAFKQIYGDYNIGACFSILLMEFFLIRIWGITGTIYFNAGINIVIGLVLYLGYRQINYQPESLSPKKSVFDKKIIIALGIASFASAIYQMFFYKMCFHIFDSNRENFAIGLALSLFALSIGAVIVRRFRINFETCMLLTVLSIGISCAFFEGFQLAVMPIWELNIASPILRLTIKLFIVSVHGLAPMIFFGATIPALLSEENNIAQRSGFLLFVSGLCNAAGYLFYVFIGHTFFTNFQLFIGIALLCLSSCVVLYRLVYIKSRLITLIVFVVLFFYAGMKWDEMFFYTRNLNIQRQFKREHIESFTLYKKGTDSVAITKLKNTHFLTYNGHPSIQLSNDDKINYSEVLSGLLPALYLDTHDKALVLGLGSGITAGTAATIYKNTDVVEINKAFVLMQSKFSKFNYGIAHNPRANIIYGDARVYLQEKVNEYDVIINSISRVDYFSAGKIYTVEFFEMISRALKEDGIFGMWVDGMVADVGTSVTLNSLKKTFKYSALHQLRSKYYFLICSNRPLKPKGIDELPIDENIIGDLEKSLPIGNLSNYIEYTQLSSNVFKNDLTDKEKRINTDNFPILEFLTLASSRNDQFSNYFLEDPEKFNIRFWTHFSNQSPMSRTEKINKCAVLRMYAYHWVSYFAAYCSDYILSDMDIKDEYLDRVIELSKQYDSGNNDILAYFYQLKQDYVQSNKYLYQFLEKDPLSGYVHKELINNYKKMGPENDQMRLKHEQYLDAIMRSKSYIDNAVLK